jgi:hypothetical protein
LARERFDLDQGSRVAAVLMFSVRLGYRFNPFGPRVPEPAPIALK